MDRFIVTNQEMVRFGIFIFIFFVFAILEVLAPRLRLATSKVSRWSSNLGITLLNSFLVHSVMILSPVAIALLTREKSWGILNFIPLPSWIEVILAVLFLDFIIYLQHIAFHFYPPLWKLHLVHHTDIDFDVTTALRFHPLEIFISLGIKMVAITLIGAPVLAVLIFEIVLNSTAMFNHSNLYLPKSLDQFLRLFLVTPDMHRVHHSILKEETNSNYGFNVPWWDRIFQTYRDQPKKRHEGITIGLEGFRNPRQLHLFRLLILPFLQETNSSSIQTPDISKKETEL